VDVNAATAFFPEDTIEVFFLFQAYPFDDIYVDRPAEL